jgi:hypothetical protein
MGHWNHNNVRRHMQVYAADGERVGHVAEVYEDSFLIHKGYLFPKNRYIPYSAISRVEENQVRLSLSSEQIQDALWQTRPDYEHHLGDPTQLFYDREHGVTDPYDDTGYERPMP